MPRYLEDLDNRRLRIWKGSHPERYQQSVRSRSTALGSQVGPHIGSQSRRGVSHSKRHSVNVD